MDPAVECRQELRQCSSARLSTAADPLRVGFGAREQAVDSADAIPHTEQTEVGAEQNQAASGIFMFARSATADRRLAGAAARVLNALALPEWVVGQDHVTFACQIREQLLVARPRLAVRGVAEWRENRRVAARTGGEIEVRGDVESRPAFERQLLDAITGSLHHAHDAWIERSALQRPADHLPHLLSDDLLALLDSLRCGNRVDHASASLPRFAR